MERNRSSRAAAIRALVEMAHIGAEPASMADYDEYAKVYRALFTGEDDDVGFWQKEASGVDAICEVGCGTGRITESLTAVKVVGVDPSGAMLELTPSPDATLVEYRKGGFDEMPAANQEFDCVIAPRGAFTHLISPKAQLRAVSELARVIAPGGRLILDNPHFLPHHPVVNSSQRRHRIARKKVDGHSYDFSAASNVDAKWGFVEFTYWVRVKAGKRADEVRYSLRTKILGLSETVLLLAAGGFRVDQTMGDYDGSAFTSGSERLITFATLAP